MPLLYDCRKEGDFNQIGVAGFSFLKGIAKDVDCSHKYRSNLWYLLCIDDNLAININESDFSFEKELSISVAEIIESWIILSENNSFYEKYQ